MRLFFRLPPYVRYLLIGQSVVLSSVGVFALLGNQRLQTAHWIGFAALGFLSPTAIYLVENQRYPSPVSPEIYQESPPSVFIPMPAISPPAELPSQEQATPGQQALEQMFS